MNAFGALLAWAEGHAFLLAVAGSVSFVLFFLTIAALPLVVIAIPRDYFTRKKAHPLDGRAELEGIARSRYSHPVLAVLALVLKNTAGFAFLTAGGIMLVTPGQGLLTMLAGLLLMNFPGKKKLELRIVSRPTVYRAVSWIRKSSGKPPVLLPIF
ncbi:MAG: hypothetical protein BWY39_01711 [Spirochaetes bacterium ADurb.Bin269]|nr:MAG: hypothetical protein BWY39_01711 [Spirochaetes bacterium ADurb.Bin269]